MPKNIPQDLEQAILELPLKEKHKLLLRLLNKNDLLIEQLHYKLLETEDDLTFRKAELQDHIESQLAESFRYPSQLMWEVKRLNAKITRHRRVTLDKYGEVELSINLVKTTLQNHGQFLDIITSKTEKLGIYLVKRMLMVLKKVKALDVDFWIDFESDINVILVILHEKITRIYARELRLPRTFEA